MNRPEMSRPISLCGLERFLCATVAVASVACSSLAEGSETWCETEGQGLGSCGAGGSGGEGPDINNPFWCIGQVAPDPLFTYGKTAALILPVLEWSKRLPLMDQGLTATLCPSTEIGCPNPYPGSPIKIRSGLLPPAIALPPGAAGVPVFEGFDGFIKFDVVPDVPSPTAADPETQFVSTYYYLGGIIAGDDPTSPLTVSQGPPILMFQRGFRSGVVASAFPGMDTGMVNQVVSKGAVAFGVYDCNGKPVEDARVELTVRGERPVDALPFRLPASRIPDAQPPGQDLYTLAAGTAGYLNVPTGFVVVTAYQRSGTRIGSVQLGSVAGQLTIGTVRPDYAKKADIRGSVPIVTPDMP